MCNLPPQNGQLWVEGAEAQRLPATSRHANTARNDTRLILPSSIKPYYHDEAAGIAIFLGDCRDVLPLLAPGSVDLVLTDPPYAAETHAGARRFGDNGVFNPTTLINFDSFTSADLRGAIELCAPLLTGWFVATVDWRHLAAIEASPPAGMRFVRFGIWVKPNGAPQFTGDRPATGWEAVAILHRDNGQMEWNGGGHHAVWTVPRVNGDHPTAKPLRLIRTWVRLFSQSDALILDPFCGSGTTLRAAKDLGRRAIGVEVVEQYAEIAARRLSQQAMALEV